MRLLVLPLGCGVDRRCQSLARPGIHPKKCLEDGGLASTANRRIAWV
jgi:hypothetical protein